MLILYALKQDKNTFASHLSVLNFYLVFNLYNTRHTDRYLINTTNAACNTKGT